jgi:hypothetical protein
MGQLNCISMYVRFYGLFVDLGRFFYIQSVGLLGRGISQSQGRYLDTEQHKTNAHRHPLLPCLEPTIPAFERAKMIHALDGAATVIGALVSPFVKSIDLSTSNSVFTVHCEWAHFTSTVQTILNKVDGFLGDGVTHCLKTLLWTLSILGLAYRLSLLKTYCNLNQVQCFLTILWHCLKTIILDFIH